MQHINQTLKLRLEILWTWSLKYKTSCSFVHFHSQPDDDIRLNLYRPNVLLNVHNLELDSYNWIYQKPLTASSFGKYFAWYMFSMTFSTVFSGKCSRCMTMYRSLKSIQIRIVDALFTTRMLFTQFVCSNWCSMTYSYSILQSSIF